jgi:hypothetical protein
MTNHSERTKNGVEGLWNRALAPLVCGLVQPNVWVMEKGKAMDGFFYGILRVILAIGLGGGTVIHEAVAGKNVDWVLGLAGFAVLYGVADAGLCWGRAMVEDFPKKEK